MEITKLASARGLSFLRMRDIRHASKRMQCVSTKVYTSVNEVNIALDSLLFNIGSVMHFTFFLAIVGVAALLQSTSAQIPTVCSDAESLENAVCFRWLPTASVGRVLTAASVLLLHHLWLATMIPRQMRVQTGLTISRELVSVTATMEDTTVADASLATMEKTAASFKFSRDAPSKSIRTMNGAISTLGDFAAI